MKPLISLLLITLLYSGTALSQGSMLACAMKRNVEIHIIFNSNKSDAELVLSDSSVKGTSSTSEHHYKFTFPETNTRRETYVVINRYNGKLEWEIGEPPFNSFNMGNLTNTGICKITKVKKRV